MTIGIITKPISNRIGISWSILSGKQTNHRKIVDNTNE